MILSIKWLFELLARAMQVRFKDVKAENIEELVQLARSAAHQAYAPYSQFRVGAALRCKDNEVFLGANVENRSFGLTICAERSAIVAAISQGRQDFAEMAIFGLDAQGPLPPCGACRQVISEFLPSDAQIHFSGNDGAYETALLKDLLPFDSLHGRFS